MSLHFSRTTGFTGLRPGFTAMLSGVLLGVCLVDPSSAGQDLRYLSFHPMPLAPQAERATPAGTASADAEYQLTPTLADASTREAAYRDAIDALRRTHGPLALPLGEQLLQLGQVLQQQGKLDAALESYEASRHVMRVNLGLESLEQTPVLKAMFSVHAAKGDVEKAHAAQEALFNLRLRHHGRDNPDAVNALLEWADWNVNLYLLLDPEPALDNSVRVFDRFNDPRLELAYDTYTTALESLQQHSGPDDERLVTTERKLAALNFITTRKIQDAYGDALRYYASSSDGFNDGDDALENASAARFHDGSSALRRALAHSERRRQPRNDDIAARMIELGDWYLLFNHRAAAMDIYRDALRFMRKASLPPEEVERIMSSGMPVPTPDTAYSTPVDASEFDGFIDVEFELTQFGMATDPHIIGGSVKDRQIERELLREIRDCKFRPKFVADAPVKRERIQLRYYYAL